jgi:carbon-monoxide dehydrogenase medium subunit
MIPAPFEYEAAESAGHALDLLARRGEDAKLMAGGHSLLPMMKLRLAVPSVVIDIGRVDELAGIRADGDDLVIGATTCHADVAASGLVRSQTPLLAYAAAQVGDPQITVSADDFFAGFFETSLEPDELLTAVRVPRRPGPDWGYQKFVRRANDWAIVGVAAAGGRIALANMGPVPVRARAAEQALAEGASVADAAGLAAEDTDPAEDIHAGRAYRQHLARVLTRRALEHQTG